MSTSILRTIARLLRPWRTIHRLERSNERLCNLIQNPELTGIEIGRENAELSAGMRGTGPQLLAGIFLGLLEENRDRAPNFIEMQFETSQGPILVTMTQPQGATPANLLSQAKQQIRQLEAELQSLKASQEAA
jgi:hypothetical protein